MLNVYMYIMCTGQWNKWFLSLKTMEMISEMNNFVPHDVASHLAQQ